MKHVKMLLLSTLFFVFASNLMADEVVQDLRYKVLATFDQKKETIKIGSKDVEYRWAVVGSKFSTKDFPKTRFVPIQTKAYPLSDSTNGSEKQSLGIRASFDKPGYNYIEIVPVEIAKDKDGNDIQKPIPIPGRATKFDLWVWTSMYDYDLKAEFVDHTGKVYVVDLGSLKHKGWKIYSAKVPTNFKRVQYLPHSTDPQIKLSRLIIWTKPSEQSTWVTPGKPNKDRNPKDLGFFVYIDHLRVLTDDYNSPYDGDILADPDKIKELWGSGQTTTAKPPAKDNKKGGA